MIREYLNACDAWFISWGIRDSWIICVWSWKFRFPEVSPTMTDSERDAWSLCVKRDHDPPFATLTRKSKFWRYLGQPVIKCKKKNLQNTKSYMIVTVCENVNFKKTLKRYFCYIISIVMVLFFNQRPFLAPVSRKSLNFSGPFRAGDIILFVSSKRRRLKARNYAVILTSIPFTTH